ncbi:hypothetical protein GCM10010399_27000 [Dactylosporangium fulvum]|uniref:Uncharacterized protein n=1 Tax=Dactylosporangium fulvum TaxID=53359 RepID=A0ABY5VQN7_9ACTN|nr:hypothetical protein [Dactylosporangium fulvum]UWP80088.1 hypothetical protein Dfulv_33670 [Dactylosporangium fulvum]
MSRDFALLLIWLGVLGMLKFGLIRIVVRGRRTDVRDVLAIILTEARRRRLERWARFAPVGVAASLALIVVGVVTGFAIES